jgi:hypothetical protein
MPFFERKDYVAKQILIKTVLIPFFFVLCAIHLPSSFAATVNLSWNASTGSNIAGYKMYYGTSSTIYTYDVDIGKNTTCSLSGLTEGKKYYFAATAYDTSNAESDYSAELSYTIPSSTGPNTIILDNGGPGTKASGTWVSSGGPNYYGTKSVYSRAVSSTYSFETACSGAQQVYLWWTYYNNRYTKVPVKIYDGSDLLDTIIINQLQAGGKWNLLGTYTFSGKAKVVVVSQSSSYTTCADAVQFAPTGEPSGMFIIDNGDSGTKASGTWKVSGGPDPYGTESLYSNTASNTYSFETSITGSREVYLWWTEHSTRCTNVSVKVFNGTTPLGTLKINQLQDGGQWNALGTYSFSGKAKVSILSYGGCTTSADAVSFFTP